jgi:O-antigen ligase
MEITWLGALLIPLGVLLLAVAPKWLQPITVFSIPFTATSLLNSSSGVPLSPLQFFGTLFVIRQLFSSRFGRILRVKREDRSQLLLLLFMSVAVLSMIMPLIINGKILVSSSQLHDLYEEPLRLTVHNIKNPLPVIFGVILSMCLIFANNTPEKIRSTIKVYVMAGVFVGLWGYFQFLCDSVLNIQYPYYLFNNALIETMQGYGWQIEIGGDLYSRISSVTHEASIFSKYLLTVLPLVLVAVWLRRPLFSIFRDRCVLVMLVGILVLTTSTTAYFGMICSVFLTAFLLRHLRAIGWRWAIYVGLISAVCFVAYRVSPVFQDFVDALLLMKYESGSALERTLSVINSWEYFRQYPILGVGWAMVTSHNLITFLLVSSGIVGLIMFMILCVYVFYRSLQTLRRINVNRVLKDRGMLVLVSGLVVSLITLVLMGILTGLEFYLGYFYFVLSMLIASNLVVLSQRANAELKVNLSIAEAER